VLDRRPMLALLLSAAFPAAADVVIPSSAFSSGAGEALFQSDVRLFNPGSAPATVTPVLFDQATGETVTRPAFTVPSRQQVRFDNVLSTLFGRTAPSFGPIRFQTTASLVVSSSVNNVNACRSGAVSGQWLPGVDVAKAMKAGVLVQLAASADGATGYRTNVVFHNPGTAAATVSAKVRKGDGTLLSTAAPVALAPNGFVQKRLDDGGTFPGVAGTTDTNLWLEFTSDQPVLAFASVIANASGDPFAIVATEDAPPPPAVTVVDVTAQQFTYTPNEVVLLVGRPYQVVFRSADTTHGVGGLSALGLSCPNGVTPEQPCSFSITPTAGQVGTYSYACTIFCGSGHAGMSGRIVVREP